MKNAPNADPARTRTLRFALAGVALAAGGVLVSPVASAVNASATEGNDVEFEVELGHAPNGWAVRYSYKTQDGSAVAGDDYESSSGKVTFNSGVKKQKVSVETYSDNVDESSSETFKLKLYDQEVNGLYQGVTGWVDSTINLSGYGMPPTMTLTGEIEEP